jgi:hypothetical protein
MTPEQRMDKFEGDLARMREDHEKSIAGLRRVAVQFLRMSQAESRAFRADLAAERETRRAEHEALMAEYREDRERRKAIEGRVDGIEEMTKFLRELLEGNLRRPEKPPQN